MGFVDRLAGERITHGQPADGDVGRDRRHVPQCQHFARHDLGTRYGRLDHEPEAGLDRAVELPPLLDHDGGSRGDRAQPLANRQQGGDVRGGILQVELGDGLVRQPRDLGAARQSGPRSCRRRRECPSSPARRPGG